MPRPQNKEEYRKELAESFAHVLEEQGLEWRKEWRGTGGGAPQNAITKANYRGCNAFLLSLISMAKGYKDPRWVTMIQIMDTGNNYHPNQQWHLKKGSRAAYVEYWFPKEAKTNKAMTWDEYRTALKNGRKPEEFYLSTRYTAVFNAQEVEGMPELKIEERTDISADEVIHKLSNNMGVPIYSDGGDRAFYSPVMDEIHLPTPGSFESEYAYNSTALHELAHSTGHFTRLGRNLAGGFGSAGYAYEELVAEMTSCFMSADLGTQPTQEHIDNHKAYVQSWIQAVREKPETLVKAIKDAQSAANYMDYKAEIISEKEYEATKGSTLEITVKTPEKEMER